ncbi:hypothetical protein ACRAWF_12080 [Streptomyces sp. L7]
MPPAGLRTVVRQPVRRRPRCRSAPGQQRTVYRTGPRPLSGLTTSRPTHL